MSLLSIAPSAVAAYGFVTALKAHLADDDNLNEVFDPELSIQADLTELRSQRTANASLPTPPSNPNNADQPALYPLLGWNHGVLQRDATMQQRSMFRGAMRSTDDVTKQVNYWCFIGNLDLPWALYHNDPLRIEMYEAAFNARARFTNMTQYTTTVSGDIGDLTYYVDWGSLDERIIAKAPIEVQAITGVVRIRGTFLVLDTSPNTFVDEINLDFRNWMANVIHGRYVITCTGQPTYRYVDGELIAPSDYNLPPSSFVPGLPGSSRVAISDIIFT